MLQLSTFWTIIKHGELLIRPDYLGGIEDMKFEDTGIESIKIDFNRLDEVMSKHK